MEEIFDEQRKQRGPIKAQLNRIILCGTIVKLSFCHVFKRYFD
jgi:hypothetical protein